MPIRVEVTIKDTMAFWQDELGTWVFDPDGRAPTRSYVYAVPEAWVGDGALTSDGVARVHAHLYGADWKNGNGDGSCYMVLDTKSRVLPAADLREGKQLG